MKYTTPFIIVFFACLFLNCYHVTLYKYYEDRNGAKNNIYEWDIILDVVAYRDIGEYKFDKAYGSTPQKYNDYYFTLYTTIDSKKDSLLLDDEKHQIQIDSLNIQFADFNKTYKSIDDYDNNKRIYNRWNQIKVSKIHISTINKKINVNIYGTTNNPHNNLKSFKINKILYYKEGKTKYPGWWE